MGKKSAAQIRRNQKRAQERGETYEAPVVQNDENDEQNLEQMKYEAALKLKKSLDDLETNESNLNSKEKRSAKRKAEAVALEEVRKSEENGDENDMTAEHLLEWLEQNKSKFQAESDTGPVITKKQRKKLNAAKTYLATLKEIEKNEDLVAKNRRSAKKKAEAIACEAGQVEDIEELLEYYESNKDLLPEKKKKRKAKEAELDENGQEVTKKKNPYILFVGQIPYDTTVDTLFSHFEKYMGKSLITKEALKIRIPNNDKDKDKQSKGFAFAEFTDPETMYECLKMHHTPLNGRRINVIRAAGGGKAARAETFKQRKIEQDDYISTTVDKIISDYIKDGKLKDGELDKGAILLCKRRSAATVEAALAEYIEKRGDRQFDNPSAFFTTVMIQVTDDGPVKNKNGKKPNFKGSGSGGRSAREGGKGPSKDPSKGPKEARSKDASVFTKSGVDMSISEKDPSAENNLSRIFPSMGRGRGRGRGAYMR